MWFALAGDRTYFEYQDWDIFGEINSMKHLTGRSVALLNPHITSKAVLKFAQYCYLHILFLNAFL